MEVRHELARTDRLINVLDYGSGNQGPSKRSVSSIYRSSSIPHSWGLVLFRCVRLLRPRKILELGASLGVSGAYLQSALDLNDDGGRLTSIEGDPTLAALAASTLVAVAGNGGEVVTGRFDDVLLPTLERMKSVDFAFIDGHHEHDPLLKYFGSINGFLARRGAVVLDDVYLWARGVRTAWNEMVRRCQEGIAFDFGRLGILFPHILEKGAP